MTLSDVAELTLLSWDTVKTIVKTHLAKDYGKPFLKGVRYLGIDEIHVGKKGRFYTIVIDLEDGRILWAKPGRGGAALRGFWRRLRRAKAKIKAVATDMSKAYIQAVRKNLPRAVHVFDHFHVIKLFNEKLTALRRELYRQLTDDDQRQILKGTRWLLLKNPENLDPLRNEKERLEDALRLNTPLTVAYYLKEDLRQIWQQKNKATARRVLEDWIRRAKASEVGMLEKFARTLEEHREGILAFYDYRISTGPLEGINNKIKTMKRQAYGFRDREFFKLKILGLHQTKYALVG
jgi:transposase